VLYRPSEQKLKNLKTKDYLGKAKLVAAEDAGEAYTTFTGVTRLQQGMTPTGAFLDNPQPARAAEPPRIPLSAYCTCVHYILADAAQRPTRARAARPSRAPRRR
jgi:hypothetical protein